MTLPTVGMAVVHYRMPHRLAHLLWALAGQTHVPARVLVWHDEPAAEAYPSFPSPPNLAVDERFGPHRGGCGHGPRADGLAELAEDQQLAWLGNTNSDNCYVPTYFERMLNAAARADADMVYCDTLTHHRQYRRVLNAEIRVGRIDAGGWLARRELVQAHPMAAHIDLSDFNGDGVYACVLAKAARRVVKLPQTLFIHN